MSAITDLKSAWTAKLAGISDAVIKAEATYLLDGYIAALTNQTALDANTIQSYTIGGRTVSRRDAAVGRKMVQDMKTELYRYVYGSTTLIDLNEGVGAP